MHNDIPDKFSTNLPYYTIVFRSWSSMKNWVMIWIWYLNVMYWVAFFYLPKTEAIWAVIAYLTVIPFVAIIMRLQRGLTRLSGLIHLPWVPFIIYLGLRLFTDQLGTPLTWPEHGVYYIWLQFLFWSTAICLLLDIADVIRWFAGERYVLGTPAAHKAGASKLRRVV